MTRNFFSQKFFDWWGNLKMVRLLNFAVGKKLRLTLGSQLLVDIIFLVTPSFCLWAKF